MWLCRLCAVCTVHCTFSESLQTAVHVWLCGVARGGRRAGAAHSVTKCKTTQWPHSPALPAHRHPHRAHHVHGARHAARHGHGTPTRLAQRGSLVASTSSGAPRHTLARARCGWLHVGCQPNRTAGPKATPRHQPSLRGGAWSAGSLARQAQRAAGHARGHTTPRALTSLPLRHKSLRSVCGTTQTAQPSN